MSLTQEEVERYSRQLALSQWSGEAQARLRESRALVVGAGALGSPVTTYLAAAGVGVLGVIDSDPVERSNLHRQPLHFTPDVGAQKVESAAAKLRLLNPQVVVETYGVRLEEQNARALVDGEDVVVDCSDSFETRYLVNDACCALGVPLVEAGLLGFDGLVLSIRPGESACYRCAFPVPPSPGSVRSCREAGVLGATAGIVGSLQALEALKLLTGVGEPLLDRLLQVEALGTAFTFVRTSRREDCRSCGRRSREAAAPR